MENIEYSSSPTVRKNKILSFIDKDIFVLNNYETSAFKNKHHAIECLIPYHVFYLTADDIKFRGADVEVDLTKDLETVSKKVRNMIEEHAFEDEGFTPQLLLYHEQRYLNSLYQNGTPSKSKNKKKTMSDRKELKIKIPRSRNFHVWSSGHKIRFRAAHSNEE